MKLEQQHDQVDWGQQGVIRPGSPVLGLRFYERREKREKERRQERVRGSLLKFAQDTG